MAEIKVSSILGFQDRTGRVQIEMPEPDVQLTQDEASNLARNIIDAVAAARMDEFLWNFAIHRLELDDGRASAFLGEWREFTHAKIGTAPASAKRGRGKYGA